MRSIQTTLRSTPAISENRSTSPDSDGGRWRRIVGLVSDDLRSRQVVQNRIPRLAELVARLHTGEFSGGRGLLLIGTPGTGKTFLLRAISEMFDIPMTTARKIERTAQDEFSFRDLIRLNLPRWSEVPRHWNDLIVDDIGSEEPVVKDFGRNYRPISEAIQLRYDAFVGRGWITHFSTNLQPEALRQRYGERCWSRLCEMCVPIVMTGEDRRKAVKVS